MLKEGFVKEWSSRRVVNGLIIPLSELYVKEDAWIKIQYQYKESFYEDDDDLTSTKAIKIIPEFFYTNYSTIENLIKRLPKYQKKDAKGGNISLISQTNSGMGTIEYPVTIKDFDIEMHYGKKFMPVYNKIVERLNEDRGKGLVLFHGIPGSGKTNLIRHLATKVNKEVLFLPPGMANQVSDPAFITFLMKHSNSIVIIEDAEKVILDRDNMASNEQGVSNILNLTDGILSDCLSIQIIATFNTSRDKIDKALLRKGRLVAEYMFDKLSIEDSNTLLKHLKKDFITNVPMTLTDIYNLEEVVNVVQQERAQIGFSNR